MKEEFNATTKAVFVAVFLSWTIVFLFFVVMSGKKKIVRQIEEKAPFSTIGTGISFEFEDSVQDWSSERTSLLKRRYCERIYQQTESEK
jgi:hypothetical protein